MQTGSRKGSGATKLTRGGMDAALFYLWYTLSDPATFQLTADCYNRLSHGDTYFTSQFLKRDSVVSATELMFETIGTTGFTCGAFRLY